MTNMELRKQLEQFPDDMEVTIMLFDPTYDNGKIIERDNYRDVPITAVHDHFSHGKTPDLISLEAPCEKPEKE